MDHVFSEVCEQARRYQRSLTTLRILRYKRRASQEGDRGEADSPVRHILPPPLKRGIQLIDKRRILVAQVFRLAGILVHIRQE